MVLGLIFVFLLVLRVISVFPCWPGKYTELPLANLGKQLRVNLVGQSLAVDTIMSSLKTFEGSKAYRHMVLWLVGREGGGKSLTASIMSSVLGQVCTVQAVKLSNLPQDSPRLQYEAEGLISRVNPCAPNLIILEGWDEDWNGPRILLHHFLEGLMLDENRHNSRVLVVLCGTVGSGGVEETFKRRLRQGLSDPPPDSVMDMVSVALQQKYALNTVTPSVVLVPFLPLSAEHVKLCVTRELLRLQREDVLINEAAVTKLMQQVVQRTLFTTDTNEKDKWDPPVASLGCKKVPEMLAYLVPPLPRDL